VTLRLLKWNQLKSGGYGLGSGASPSLITGGNSCPGLSSLGWEAMVPNPCAITAKAIAQCPSSLPTMRCLPLAS
jgi:hypothetical protein